MRNSPASGVLSAAPRRLSIPFDSTRLRGMTPSERRVALARLASLLLEAADIAIEERQPAELTATRLSELHLPLDWTKQRRLLTN